MKKTFEIPTIEKINMCIADTTMCTEANEISSLTNDAGIIMDMTGTQLSNGLGG